MSKGEEVFYTTLFFIVVFLGSALIVYFLKTFSQLREIHEAYLVPYWLLIIYLFIKARGISFRSYGFTLTGISLNLAVYSLVLGLGLVILALTLGLAYGIYDITYLSKMCLECIIFHCLLITIASFGEEAVFRGYILNSLIEAMGKVPSIITTSLLFAILHISNPGYSIFSFIQLMLGGILLSIMMIYGKTILYPTLYHAFWNFGQAFLGFPVSGHKYFSSIFIVKYKISSSILTGGIFGLEGSILGIFVTIIGLIITYFAFTKTNHIK